MIEDIRLFINIVHCGSLSKAAQKLNMPTPTLSRRLQKLEQQLDRQLIYRSARRFQLTSDGLEYYQAYASIIEQYETTTLHLQHELNQNSGELTILAPTNISVNLLAPMWTRFIKTYPAIRLNLLLSNKNEDFVSANADIAIRVGQQADSGLYQKKLCSIKTILVASKDYLNQYGEPQSIADLSEHRFVVSEFLTPWHLTQQSSGTTTQFFPNVIAKANDLQLIRQLVNDGLGISLLPTIEVSQELKDQQLIQVLTDWQGKQRDIFAIWNSGRLLNPKAKLFREYVQAYLTEHLCF